MANRSKQYVPELTTPGGGHTFRNLRFRDKKTNAPQLDTDVTLEMQHYPGVDHWYAAWNFTFPHEGKLCSGCHQNAVSTAEVEKFLRTFAFPQDYANGDEMGTKFKIVLDVMYEVVTEESAEVGDADARGMHREGVEFVGDALVEVVRDVVQHIINNDSAYPLQHGSAGLEPSSSVFHDGVWYTHTGTRSDVGTVASTSYHLKNTSMNVQWVVYEQITRVIRRRA